MKTATAKKANRGHLKRAAAKGQLFIQVRGKYSDDHAYGNDSTYGRTDGFEQSTLSEARLNMAFVNGSTESGEFSICSDYYRYEIRK